MFELAEEALDPVALAIEPLREAGLPFAIGFGGDVGRGALVLDQAADTVGIIGFVAEQDGAGAEAIEQRIDRARVVRLPGGQGEPDRAPLGVDEGVDLGREAAAGATETMISTPLFAVAACWCARIEVLSIIWISPSYAAVMASISRSQTPALRHRTKRL